MKICSHLVASVWYEFGVKRGTSNLSQSLKMTLFWDIASCGIVEVD